MPSLDSCIAVRPLSILVIADITLPPPEVRRLRVCPHIARVKVSCKGKALLPIINRAGGLQYRPVLRSGPAVEADGCLVDWGHVPLPNI